MEDILLFHLILAFEDKPARFTAKLPEDIELSVVRPGVRAALRQMPEKAPALGVVEGCRLNQR
jgi:hypothetical protein